MIKIDLTNVEEDIFHNKEIANLFPEFRHLFEQWKISCRVPGLKTLGKRTLIEFLNSLEKQHVKRLEDFFGDSVIIEALDSSIVKSHTTTIDQIENDLCDFNSFFDFCITRNKDKVSVTFWR